ncbi:MULTISPECIES: metallophosphoesterase [unclassified Pseudomonas]|uniref:metallophosphoesterase n=1 Tax=unclassified Pseudomonas TaxID=196821 RepID=UPI00249AABFF|nr:MULTISPECIES: metallophosphoesterase [unclassified Pseudomonas]MDI3248546.1 metallophosphoesterase family protein [Pseudomonas sp. AL10]MDI3264434.1 metallophosphoesterase family protein [Pseudomonas sp. AL15]
MRLLVMSDLHVEFQPVELPDPSLYDVAILAGDINIKGRSSNWACEHFSKETVLVAGNHEFYKSSWYKTLDQLSNPQAAHVHFLEQRTLVLDGVRFVGCTGWSDFEGTGNAPLAMLDARALMNDYKVIRVEPQYRTLVPQQTRKVAQESREWLHRELEQPFQGKTIVVTHFPPLMHFVPDYGTHPHLRAAYGNNWEEFLDMKVDFWIFGHTHVAVDETINGIRFLSNPRGYPGEDVDFNNQCVITL